MLKIIVKLINYEHSQPLKPVAHVVVSVVVVVVVLAGRCDRWGPDSSSLVF